MVIEGSMHCPILLKFWGSWCQQCRGQSHVLEGLWRTYKSQNLLVIGVAVQDTLDTASQAIIDWGKSYPVFLDKGGSTSLDYGVTGVPETVFIDKNGVIFPCNFPSRPYI